MKINNTINKAILVLICGLFNQTVNANPLAPCDASRENAINYMRCLDQQISRLEDERKLWGNNIIFILEEIKKKTGRGGALRLFKKSQNSFKEHAENHCRWQYVSLLPDPTSSAIRYKQCLIEINHQRILELQQAAKQK